MKKFGNSNNISIIQITQQDANFEHQNTLGNFL